MGRWILSFDLAYNRLENGTSRIHFSPTKSKSKDTKKYDYEFAVATITRIRGAIAAI